MLDEAMKKDLSSRLQRIRGQVDGIQTMVADDRYCIDILHQITAVRRALEKVALKVVASQDDLATDGQDYIEGGGGCDVIFGNLGQDDLNALVDYLQSLK